MKIDFTVTVIGGTMVIRVIITYGLSRGRGTIFHDYLPAAEPSSRYTFFIACLRSHKLPLTETLSARAEPRGGRRYATAEEPGKQPGLGAQYRPAFFPLPKYAVRRAP